MNALDAAFSNQLGPVFNSASAHGVPLQADEVALTLYCSVATLAALVWTWALCVPEEVEIVNRKGLSTPIIVYFVTRLVTLGACICTVLLNFQVDYFLREVEPEIFRTVFASATQSTTALLFFFRIRAVYQRSQGVRYGFSALWILITISPSMMLVRPNFRCYMPHKYCHVWGPTTLPCNALMLLNDTLVFIGVSLHSYKNIAVDTSRLSRARRFKMLVQGDGLYKVSKVLLNSGQLYYGSIIGFQIWAAIAVFLGVRYSQIASLSGLPFASTMACKVFRMVLLCDTTEDPLNTQEVHEMLEGQSYVD